jgi:hypothetical protein
MKILNKTAFKRVKSYLSLSSVGEVMMREHLGRATVSNVDACDTYEEYVEFCRLFEEQEELERIKANQKLQEELIYITPKTFKDVIDHIDERMDRLEGLIR